MAERTVGSGGRLTVWLLLAAGLLLFFPGLGARDLWNPNEPVFAEGAREMQVRGDWLLPYVNDQIYVDKPILFFWAIRVASLPWGEVNSLAARLPSALAALLTVVAVYWFGRRYFGERTGWLGALVMATCPIFVWQARFAQMDPMLTLFMFLCVACFQRAREERAAWWLAASGAWSGLAFLTKGPVGLVLPGAAALLLLVIERDLKFLRRPAWLAGAAGFLALGMPWYLILGVTGNTEWLREFFLRQNVERFVDPFDHAQPFYYYGIRFFSDLFPWSFLLPLVAMDRPGPDRPAGERSAWRLMALYVVVVLAFFSVSGAKRGVYILPLYPAYGLLAGRLLDRVLAGTARAGLRKAALWVVGGAGLLLVIAGAALVPATHARRPEFVGAAVWLAAVTLLGGITTVVLMLRRRRGAAVGALLASMAGLYLVTALVLVPQVDPLKSARAFSQRILAHAGQDSPLCSYSFWKWRSNYLFYTRRTMPNLESLEAVDAFLARPEPVFLLVNEGDRAALEKRYGQRWYLLESESVGSKTIHLYSNRPPGEPKPPDLAGATGST